MCTSIAMKRNNFYFGRNMDIDYSFGERVILTPRSFPLNMKKSPPVEKHYAIIGIGAVADGCPLYADGMNENGLCMAGLKFPDNAVYSETPEQGKAAIAPYELIPWVLGKCRNINEAKALLSETDIIAEPFSDALPLSPLHWHIADKNGSAVVEKTVSGMNVYNNPAGVLTNNPPFPFHLENLSQYAKLTPDYESESTNPKPFGLGFGGIGLPGDFSPVSRFVRAEFLLRNSAAGNDTAQLFHILDSVAIPMGAVTTPDGKHHITTYSCCMDTEHLTYLYKTYNNNQLTAIGMNADNMNGNTLMEFPLVTEQKIFSVN